MFFTLIHLVHKFFEYFLLSLIFGLNLCSCLLKHLVNTKPLILTLVNFLYRVSVFIILNKSLTVVFLERIWYSQIFSRSLKLCVFEFGVIILIIELSPYWEGEITRVGGLDVILLIAKQDKNNCVLIFIIIFDVWFIGWKKF